MMSEELGLQIIDEGDTTMRDGLLMFLAFAIFGSLPLLGYVVSFIASTLTQNLCLVCVWLIKFLMKKKKLL